MKRNTIGIIILIILLALASGFFLFRGKAEAPISPGVGLNEEEEVGGVIIEFGTKLRLVSLTGSPFVVALAMDENYKEYASENILMAWKANPLSAPGQLTSDPWPERIEVLEVRKMEDNSYDVQGKIIEVYGPDGEGTDKVLEIPLALKLREVNGKWIITGSEIRRPQ